MSSKVTIESGIPSNRSKADLNTTEHHAPMGNPRGLQWNNNSCAFDAILAVLFNIWQDDATERTAQFKDVNEEYLGRIVDGFSNTRPRSSTNYTLEEVRDFLRQRLQRADPVTFPWGGYAGIQQILDYLLNTDRIVTSSSVRCPNNHPLKNADLASSSCHISILRQCPNIQAFINDQSIECASRCRICHSHIVRKHIFEDSPAIIAFDMTQYETSLSESIVITTSTGDRTTYKLRGVMYYQDNHFTSRFISKSGRVWYHDGLLTGRQMVPEGCVGDTELGSCRYGTAICSVYVIS